MMKNYMSIGNLARSKKPEGDSVGKAIAPFPEEKAVMSIYGRLAPHESHHNFKLTDRVINSVSASVPEYLCWSESPITFDRMDHLDSIPKLGRFPLIIYPLVGMTRLTKALMDAGSDLNLMYLDTFEGLGLTQDQLQSSPQTFYGVFPGKQYAPLGWVTLPVTFGDASNYRTEMLTFEVVDFSSPYHVILGWPCYVKFMDIPSYTYLKLKILGHARVITVEARTHQALDYEQSSVELATAMVTMVEQRELSLRLPMMLLNPEKPLTFRAFKADKDAKAVQIKVRSLAKNRTDQNHPRP
jgi:hypothetical protein